MNKTTALFTCCNANDPYLFRLLSDSVGWILFELCKLDATSAWGQFLHYFIYTSTKIVVLLSVLIYLVGLFRAGLDVEKVRRFLKGKNRIVSYFLAALFGALTPFCSCAAVPIFIAFTASGIPVGITIAFLVTSPIINEIGILLLYSEFGKEFATLYIALGIGSGILAGYIFDLFSKEQFLRSDLEMGEGEKAVATKEKIALDVKKRHLFAIREVRKIVVKVSPWILLGITIAGTLNLFLTPHIVSEIINRNSLFSVPVAVLMGIPLYSSPAGVIPIGTVLLNSGVKTGTVLSFMMSCTAASFPEFILLRHVLTIKGVLFLFGTLLVLFTLIGIILNVV